MIGNDIIDLKYANFSAKHLTERYLDKVLTKSEKTLMQQAQDKVSFFWTCWALKESTYKITNKLSRVRKFNPRQYECQFSNNSSENSFAAKIETTLGTFQAEVESNEHCIHVLVNTDALAPIQCQVHKINVCNHQHQSQQARLLLKEMLSADMKCSKDLIELKNIDPWPGVWVKGRLIEELDLTISHHGHWVSVAYQVLSTRTT
ncbi:MAG: 4'-phosphopantetheinyl transferase superfamily protein [Bacteroidota bacterium]